VIRRTLVVTFAALVVVAGCGRKPAPVGSDLRTEEVAPAPDAHADLEGDAVARPAPAQPALSGQLPAGFPRDVPLPAPASLVDFDARSVTLEVPTPLAATRASYGRRLAAAGFAPSAGGAWTRGARRLVVAYEAHGDASRVRIEIPGGG
jgi:hypothetical protein